MVHQKQIHLAIVDDHFAIRTGYRDFLSNFPYISQISLFSEGSSLLSYFRSAPNIDFILCDVELKNENGLDLCRYIKGHYKNVSVLMLSTFHSAEYIVQSERLGADGYLFKDEGPEEIRRAFDTIILHKQKYYSIEAKEKIFDYERAFRNQNSQVGQQLTPKEILILQMICDGNSNRQIAMVLNRHEATIDKHRQNIMHKTGTHKVAELIRYAIKQGLI